MQTLGLHNMVEINVVIMLINVEYYFVSHG